MTRSWVQSPPRAPASRPARREPWLRPPGGGSNVRASPSSPRRFFGVRALDRAFGEAEVASATGPIDRVRVRRGDRHRPRAVRSDARVPSSLTRPFVADARIGGLARDSDPKAALRRGRLPSHVLFAARSPIRRSPCVRAPASVEIEPTRGRAVRRHRSEWSVARLADRTSTSPDAAIGTLRAPVPSEHRGPRRRTILGDSEHAAGGRQWCKNIPIATMTSATSARFVIQRMPECRRRGRTDARGSGPRVETARCVSVAVFTSAA